MWETSLGTIVEGPHRNDYEEVHGVKWDGIDYVWQSKLGLSLDTLSVVMGV